MASVILSLVSANYRSFTVLTSLSMSSLYSNIGFYLTLIYFVTFFLFSCVARRVSQIEDKEDLQSEILEELEVE